MPTPTKSTRTPGPWQWTACGQAPACVYDAQGRLICDLDTDEDAELIASAPTLKAERDEAVALLRRLVDTSTQTEGRELTRVEARALLATLGGAK